MIHGSSDNLVEMYKRVLRYEIYLYLFREKQYFRIVQRKCILILLGRKKFTKYNKSGDFLPQKLYEAWYVQIWLTGGAMNIHLEDGKCHEFRT